MTDTKRIQALRNHNIELNKLVKESIQDALLYLMDIKDYRSISITELCKKAGVSRVSFYSNYQTLNDVIDQIIKDSNNRIFLEVGKISMGKVSKEWYINFFNIFKEEINFFNVVLKSNFVSNYISLVNSYICENISSKEEKIRKIIWVGGLINFTLEHKEEIIKKDAEEIASYVYKYLY